MSPFPAPEPCGRTADFGPPPAALPLARAEPREPAPAATVDFGPPAAALVRAAAAPEEPVGAAPPAAGSGSRAAASSGRAASAADGQRTSGRACRVAGCGRRAVEPQLCEEHARLRASGLLRLGDGARSLCLAQGCESAPGPGGPFCASHQLEWRAGRLALRPKAVLLFEAVATGRVAAWGRALAVATAILATAAGVARLSGQRPERAASVAVASGAPGSTGRVPATTRDPWVRGRSRTRPAGDLDSERERALVERLRDASPEARRRAAAALGDASGERSLEALVGALVDPDPGVRDAARRALARRADRGAAPLSVRLAEAAFRTATPEERIQLVASLGSLGREHALPWLGRTLGERTDPELKLAAIGALGWTRTLEAVPALRPFLYHPEAAFRAEACIALGRLGVLGAVEWLIPRLDDAAPRVRANAHWALRTLTGERLAASSELWRDWWSAGVASAYAGLDQALAELEAAEPVARPALLLRLRGIRDARVVDAALRELGSPCFAARVAAARVLGAQMARAAVPDLIEALEDTSDEVRAAAHAALVAISGEPRPAEPRAWLEWWDREGAE